MAEDSIDFDLRLKTQQAAAEAKAFMATLQQQAAQTKIKVAVEPEGRGLSGSAQDIGVALNRASKVFAGAEAGLASIEIGIGAAHTVAGLLSGDLEKSAQGAREMEAAIKSIPLFGERIIRIGAQINNLFTGTADAVKQIEADTKRIDQHTTHIAQQAKEVAAFNQKFGGFVAGIGPRSDLSGLSDSEATARRVVDLRRELQKMLESPDARDARGNQTEAAKSMAADARMRIIALETSAAEAVFRERMALTGREEELRLRMIGDVAGAEKQALVNAHEAAIDAAKKKYPELIPIIDSIFEKQGQLLDQQLKEAEEKAKDRMLDTLTDMEAEFQRDLSQELDRQARERRETEDMLGKAADLSLRAEGRPRAAEFSALEREILDELVGAGDDPNRQFAAESLGRGRFEAVSASTTDLTNRLSGRQGEDVSAIRKLATDMLDRLTKIADKPAAEIWEGR
jgi:hypothetical protein